MAYTAEISRANPSCFLFLIDQSGSMQEILNPSDIQAMEQPFSADGKTYTHTANGKTKAEEVADAINRILQNLSIKCAKEEGIRDYFEIGVIGYGGENISSHVCSAFGGALSGRDLIKISELAQSPARLEKRTKKVSDGAGGLVEQEVRFPVWFDPKSIGGTPMCKAMELAHKILSDWVAQHQLSYPPILINITDGESTDGDPTQVAESIKHLGTGDGNVNLFNVHISSQKSSPVEYPDTDSGLPDQYAKLLFNISSALPNHMQNIARQEGLKVTDGSRGFVFNADIVSLIRFLDIGTRPSNLR